MITYSQNDEQRLAIEFFEGHVGTFLDLGANNGEHYSNSRALALLGWSGVLVEPSPTAFTALQKIYRNAPDIECHNVGMCEGNGPSILHESAEHIGNGDHALLSTAKASEMKRWKGAGVTFKPVDFECVTFQELLKRSQFAAFDFITIDIEGLDLEVLQQIDLTAVGCRMLCVEVNDRDIAPYVTYCASHGMRVLTRNAENILFIR